MTGCELLEAMSYVDEQFIQEAEQTCPGGRKRHPWPSWVCVAACLCILIAGVTIVAGPLGRKVFDASSADCAANESAIYAANGSDAPSDTEAAMDTASDVELEKEDIRECPSLTLRVEGTTGEGFVGTVTETVDTDVFEVGTELNVVIEENTRYYENGSGSAFYGIPGESLAEGMLVQVQFVDFDVQSGTITVDHIEILDDTD